MEGMLNRRNLLNLAIAALLLFAQYGAVTHALSHVHAGKPAQSQQHDGGKQSSSSVACAFHASFAEVLGAVGSCGFSPLAAAAVEAPVPLQLSSAFAPRLLIPDSRGPPALL
jgi:hypothetical protein